MEGVNTINSKAVGGLNESLIVNTIRRRGPISRVDIAKLTGLTAPTVTNISGKLIEHGLIHEYMVGEYSGGRRPVLLKVNSEIANMIIVDIRSKEMIGYLINGGLEIKEQTCYDIQHLKEEKILSLLENTIEQCYSSENGKLALAIGIIVRGPVMSREGLSLFSPSAGWRNVPLKYLVEKQFQLPVFVENDMRAMALGAYHYGPYRDIKNAVFLGVGGGIGSGIILNGELYRGLGDSAGEIGHTVVDVDGPLCSCGNYGCLEAMASESALVNITVKSINDGESSLVSEMVKGDMDAIRPKHIYAAAEEGDLLAIKMLQHVAKYIGMGAANIINIFNPQLVLIGGGIVKGRVFMEETMMQVIKERALASCYSLARIEFSSEGRQDALKGIVDVVMEGIFLR
ncbi:ROK family transcriptional regulator [Pelosinus fermentans]|uniref:Glucokinase n=1 Tax=Pelosinus fermentans JBW45 TaxID=1192197 RepID=I8U129_9FIRM|nr:ROK family protein [Pelosinus fermentans]AJQ27975.1 Glucokinase [Pelosinus fermentans JBW45]